MNHIFISHSSKDAAVANRLVDYLEGQGHKCWIAPRDIAAGCDYTDVINDALEGCHTLVFLLSPHSLDSQWVKKEIATAMTLNKRVLPFKISRCQLSSGYLFMLNNVQIIDATDSTADKFKLLLNEIDGVPAPVMPETPKKKSNGKLIALVLAAIAAICLILFLVLHNTGKSEEEQPTATELVVPATEPATDSIVAVPQTNTKPAKNETRNNEKRQTATASSSTKTEQPAASETTATEEKQEKVEEPEKTETTAPKVAEKPKKDNAAIAYEKKFNTAVSLYINKDYKNALPIFEELHRTNPSDRRLSNYINDCKRNIK